MLFFITYIAIAVLTAFCYCVFWLTCKHKVEKPAPVGEMLQRALVYALIWPVPWCLVLLDRDRLHFLHKNESAAIPKLDDAYFARREREWQDLIANFPVCGSHMVYQGTDSYSESLPATFIFESDVLTPFIFEAIGPNSTDQYCQERILYHWLVKREHALQVCTLIDKRFDRFGYITAKMIRNGLGAAFCKDCQKVFSAKEIRYDNEYTGKSWQFEALYCPNQHLLLRNRTIHFC